MPLPRLLVLSPWFPYPPDNGSRQRAFYLLRELAKRYTIHLIAGAQDDSPAEVPAPLAALCDEVDAVPWRWPADRRSWSVRDAISPIPRAVRETINPPLTAAISDTLARCPPDTVLVLQRGMDTCLPPATFRFPVILDEAEVSGWISRRDAGFRERFRDRLAYAKSVRYWPARLQRYNAITAVSENEANAVRRLAGDNARNRVFVVPNGVDCAAFEGLPRSEIVPGRLIYAGSPAYGPNRDAVRWFVQEILPRIAERIPEAHLVVTGRYGLADVEGLADGPRVRLTGYLPDLRPELARAAVSVAPLQSGGGTRLKILEAWAAGIPVVATAVGDTGLDAIDNCHLLRRNGAEGFAGAVVELLNDPQRAGVLAQNARAFVAGRYDWAILGAALVDVIESARGRNIPGTGTSEDT